MTLAELGLNFQLGHKLGTPCPSPAIITKFVIIDVDGIHTVNMAFCDCTQGIEDDTSSCFDGGSFCYYNLPTDCHHISSSLPISIAFVYVEGIGIRILSYSGSGHR